MGGSEPESRALVAGLALAVLVATAPLAVEPAIVATRSCSAQLLRTE